MAGKSGLPAVAHTNVSKRERGLAEREGIEPTPRHKCRGDDFEDRDDHQARITLRNRLILTCKVIILFTNPIGR